MTWLQTFGLGLSLAFAPFTIFTIQSAHAGCVLTSGTGGPFNPGSGSVVTCTADAPNPEPNGIDEGNDSDNVTVIFEDNAGLTTDGEFEEGIFLDNFADIRLGAGASIATVGNSARGIRLNDNGRISLGTGASIGTAGGAADAILAGDNTVVTLGQNARVTTLGPAISGIGVGENSTVTLQSGASVETMGLGAVGINAGDGATVTLGPNAGVTLKGNGGIGVHVGANSMLTLQSGASVVAEGSGSLTVVLNDGVVLDLQNGASIRSIGGGSTGVEVEAGGDATINLGQNSRIQTQGANATAIDTSGGELTLALQNGASVATSGDNAEGVNATGGGAITLLSGSSISTMGVDASAIQAFGSDALTIHVNAGATLSSAMGIAINSLGTGAENIIVGGTVTGGGGTAMALGDGDDRLELQAGFDINGIVDAEGGMFNTLVFGGDQDAVFDVSDIGAGQQYRNFGVFQKEGASTWMLTGNSNSMNNLAINGGTVLFDGKLDLGLITVNSGGTFGGDGEVVTLLAKPGSTIAPGMSSAAVGVLKTSAAVFDAGSTFAIDIISATQADSLALISFIQLNGGTVQVGGNLAAATAGQQYTIVTAPDGIFGSTFDGVTSPSAFIDFSLTHNANDVVLNVDARRAFGSAAQTFNQQQVAGALDGLGTTGDAALVQTALLRLSLDEARAAFDAIAGGVHADGASAASGSADDFTELLMSFLGLGGDGVQTASLGMPASASYGADFLPGTNATMPVAWMGSFGGYSDVDGDGNASGFEATTFGLAGGVETTLDAVDAVVGLSLGYSISDLDLTTAAQGSHNRNVHAGLYARMGAGRLEEGFAARGAVSYAHHWLETQRIVAFGGISRTAIASYNGYSVSADADVRYNFAVDMGVMDNTFLAPFVNVGLRHTDLGSFTETGAGTLNLSGDADGYNRATAAVGLAFSGERSLGNAIWRPTWSVAYDYVAGDEAEANLSLAGSPTSFVTRGTEESRHRIRFGTSSEIILSDSAVLTFATDSVWSKDRRDLSAKLGVKFTF